MFVLTDVSLTGTTHQNILSSLCILKIHLALSARSIYIWLITKHIELMSHGYDILKSISFLKINIKEWK